VKQLLRKAQVKGREEQYQTYGIFRRPRFNETVKRVFPTPSAPEALSQLGLVRDNGALSGPTAHK
jgi:hypothetical protein